MVCPHEHGEMSSGQQGQNLSYSWDSGQAMEESPDDASRDYTKRLLAAEGTPSLAGNPSLGYRSSVARSYRRVRGRPE